MISVFISFQSVIRVRQIAKMSRTNYPRIISAIKLCHFTILLFIVRNNVINATDAIDAATANKITWTTKWEFDSKCEKIDENCLKLEMDQMKNITLTLSDLVKQDLKAANATIHLISDSDILHVQKEILVDDLSDSGEWNGSIEVDAVFIGKTNLYVEIHRGEDVSTSDKLLVIIVRKTRIIDTVFIVSVASLVSILYINFGAALDLRKVKNSLRKPIGPAIAFFCHFVFLPVVSKH